MRAKIWTLVVVFAVALWRFACGLRNIKEEGGPKFPNVIISCHYCLCLFSAIFSAGIGKPTRELNFCGVIKCR